MKSFAEYGARQKEKYFDRQIGAHRCATIVSILTPRGTGFS